MSERLIVVAATIDLETETCAACGVLFAMPRHLREQYLKCGTTFYCPNGHSNFYGKSEADRLRHKLDQTEAELERAIEQRDGALHQVSAHKGVVSRLKNRIHNGVCTECHRHFVNLERHMKTKHGK